MMNYEDKLSQAVFERVANDLKSGILEATRLITERADDNSEMMWGDVGMIYFWIQRQALEQQQYEKTWMILQCC